MDTTTKNQLDRHCTKPKCHCNHVGCYRGWIDNDQGTTRPCMYCRENLSERLYRAAQAEAKGYPQAALYRIMTSVNNDN